jgi:hypothetical protein
MKVICTADIDAPIETVVALFDNNDNLKKWQDGFKSLTPISGTPGTEGAKSEIIFVNGKHTIKLVETIQVKKLPAEMKALYEHSHGSNTTLSHFEALPGGQARFTMTVEPVHIIGLLPKIMAALMPGMFKKQTQKWVDNFKAFVEGEQLK